MSEEKTIAVVGGTGNLGAALARRWAKAGLKVIIGSRTKEGAESAAASLGFGLSGMTNGDAAAAADIVVVTVPWGAQEGTLADIAPHVAGKIVVDTTVPLVPPKVMREIGRATSELQSLMRSSYAVFCLKKKKSQIYTLSYSMQLYIR